MIRRKNKRYWLLIVCFFSFGLISSDPVFAGPVTDCKDGKEGKDCPPVQEICFNLVCSYQREGREGTYEKCQAAARFKKWVTAGGGEIWDRSEGVNHPEFEVECDEYMIFNNSALRYTDSLGTRIQGRTGPYPAVVIPRGSLRDGHSYVPSSLEFSDQHLRGYCYVYSGPQ